MVDREPTSPDADPVTADDATNAPLAVILRDDLESIAIDDEMCVFDPRIDQVLTLNSTASAVWSLCDGRRSEDDVVAAVAATYGTDLETVDADVRSLIGAWRDAGLLVSG